MATQLFAPGVGDDPQGVYWAPGAGDPVSGISWALAAGEVDIDGDTFTPPENTQSRLLEATATTFRKQPRERIWIPVGFADRLSDGGDAARAVEPAEMDAAPAGITVHQYLFDSSTGIVNVLVSGGITGRTYLLTMWIHTVSGQKIERQVRLKVKEVLK